MSPEIYYGHLCFESSLVFAMTKDLKKIKFSKQERSLLKAFTENPGQLLSRVHLMDKISENELEKTDRNIDYLISRLRKKLGEDVDKPIFIATQYGEGYIWVAKQYQNFFPVSQDIYLSISEIFGLDIVKERGINLDWFIDELLNELQKSFGPQRLIKRLSSSEKQDKQALFHHQNARYVLELSFIFLNESLRCSIVIISRMTGHIFDTLRYSFEQHERPFLFDSSPSKISKIIREKIWFSEIFRSIERRASDDEPLFIGLYKSTNSFDPSNQSLDEIEVKLRRKLKESTHDYQTAMMLIANFQTKILIGMIDDPESHDEEIEELLLSHLSKLQNDPLYLSYAADRIYHIGHKDLGEKLAKRALDIGPSYACTYSTIGWIKITQGLFEEGLTYIDYCLEMTEAKSPFFKLLMTHKCIALKASENITEMRKLALELISDESDQTLRSSLHVYFLAGDSQKDKTKAIQFIKGMPESFTITTLKIAYFSIVNSFACEHHRENLMRDIIGTCIEAHGINIMPEAIKASLPRLFENLDK